VLIRVDAESSDEVTGAFPHLTPHCCRRPTKVLTVALVDPPPTPSTGRCRTVDPGRIRVDHDPDRRPGALTETVTHSYGNSFPSESRAPYESGRESVTVHSTRLHLPSIAAFALAAPTRHRVGLLAAVELMKPACWNWTVAIIGVQRALGLRRRRLGGGRRRC